jgi:hypothetical protein
MTPNEEPSMKYLFATAVVSGLLVAGGYLHGRWTDRWVKAVEPEIAARRYHNLPMTIGDWDGQALETKQTPDDLAGMLQRRYVNRKTGQSVTVMLVCGRSGPASIHEPEVCYGASGFSVGAKRHIGVEGLKGEFWTADASRQRATEENRVRLFWAWNDGFGWAAPDDPRRAFAQRPVLHKLYVLRELDSLEEPLKDDACETFLQALLPELDRTLFVP